MHRRSARALAVFTAACLAAGCAPQAAPAAPPPPAQAPRADPSPSRAAPADPPAAVLTLSPAAPAPPPTAAPAASGEPQAGDATTFPPRAFSPPFPRTAKSGDGAWAAMPEGSEGGAPVMVRSTVHPDRIKGHVYVAVVAIDLHKVALRLVAGTEEPVSDAVPQERRPGLVPDADQAALIAVFNGGFMAQHGRYGMRVREDTFLPPREDACAVGVSADGIPSIAPWAKLRATESALAAYRQTPACLVEDGKLHPFLQSDDRSRLWGAADGGNKETRRSAVGVDATGRTLFYGLGEWVTARLLAESMQAAGSVAAAELDINWSYTRFLLFGRPAPGAPLEVTSTLVPKVAHSRFGYVAKPSTRDFFYLVRR